MWAISLGTLSIVFLHHIKASRKFYLLMGPRMRQPCISYAVIKFLPFKYNLIFYNFELLHYFNKILNFRNNCLKFYVVKYFKFCIEVNHSLKLFKKNEHNFNNLLPILNSKSFSPIKVRV